jgi:hypothetical protein
MYSVGAWLNVGVYGECHSIWIQGNVIIKWLVSALICVNNLSISDDLGRLRRSELALSSSPNFCMRWIIKLTSQIEREA